MTITTGAASSSLYPLGFVPIYEYRLWGGRRLSEQLTAPLPGEGPVGEAWLLSDRDGYMSPVLDGWLKGWSIREVLREFPEQVLGASAGSFPRFPLLLKFIDAHEDLSVQVHPSDRDVTLLPAGEPGKTEAWVVLRSESHSRVYEGLTPGTTVDDLRAAVDAGTVAEHLIRFAPKPGDGFFIPAGTVHSLGGDVVVFEVQQNSDVTFRLYDWDRTDPNTGRPRALQVSEALACVDVAAGRDGPVAPVLGSATSVPRERLFLCDYFTVWRLRGTSPFTVGSAGSARVVVCIDGGGELEHDGEPYPCRKGDVLLLPAAIGACTFRPDRASVVLEIAIPEPSTMR